METAQGSGSGHAGSRDRAARTIAEAAEEFLSHERIAVVGVSRDTKQPANLIYRRLRDADHRVYPVNPAAAMLEGDRAYPSIGAVPGPLDGAVIVTTPEVAVDVVGECAEAGVPRVWLHRGIGPGSTSEHAVALCREHGIDVIPAGCPNMFGATSDAGHRCMLGMLKLTGKIPRRIPAA